MPRTEYYDLKEINKLQSEIMEFIQGWVHTEKTPVPLKNIISNMETAGIKNFTSIKALNVLVRKGYIRRAHMISNKTFFVQLRRV